MQWWTYRESGEQSGINSFKMSHGISWSIWTKHIHFTLIVCLLSLSENVNKLLLDKISLVWPGSLSRSLRPSHYAERTIFHCQPPVFTRLIYRDHTLLALLSRCMCRGQNLAKHITADNKSAVCAKPAPLHPHVWKHYRQQKGLNTTWTQKQHTHIALEKPNLRYEPRLITFKCDLNFNVILMF